MFRKKSLIATCFSIVLCACILQTTAGAAVLDTLEKEDENLRWEAAFSATWTGVLWDDVRIDGTVHAKTDIINVSAEATVNGNSFYDTTAGLKKLEDLGDIKAGESKEFTLYPIDGIMREDPDRWEVGVRYNLPEASDNMEDAQPGEKIYGPGDEIPTLPTGFWFPQVVSGASFQIAGGGGNAIIEFNKDGYIENDGITYTCISDSGCKIENRRVTKGMIRVTGAGVSENGDDQQTQQTGSGPTIVQIQPASITSPAIGEQLSFDIDIVDGENVAGYQVTVQFDTTALRYVSGENGDFLPAGAFWVPPAVHGNRVTLAATSVGGGGRAGNGTLARFTFEVIAVKASTLTLPEVLLSNEDAEGYQPQVEGAEITEPTQLKGDVNGDGIVNIQDLVFVASRFGETGESPADLNGDGVVNIVDLVLVAGAFGDTAAAPSLYSQASQMLTAADIQLWLTQAQHLTLTDATSQRGILFLEQLLAMLIPKKTVLLPNYPNPFNPETWIPYQLARDADVTLTIYAVNGHIVRRLALGHQPAGLYQSRSRAAYWDGKNRFGEPVANGVYFYTLTAGDFTATRKMLILK